MSSPLVQRRVADAIPKERKALDLWMAGVPFARIAEECGYADVSSARKAAKRALDRDYPPAKVDEYRQQQTAVLETLRRAIWPAALRGDLGAVREARNLTREIMRLHGLAAPVKVEITSEVDDAIMALAAQVNADGAYEVTDARQP